MKSGIVALYEEVAKTHAAAHVAMQKIQNELDTIASEPGGMEEMADVALAMKQISERADDTRREAERIKQRAIDRGCMLWALKREGEPIRTEYVTASPDVKQMCALPDRRKNAEAFRQLMIYMGIDRRWWDVGDDRHAPIALNWAGMLDYVSDLVSMGEPMPPGVDTSKTYTQYRMLLRARKEISGAVLPSDSITQ